MISVNEDEIEYSVFPRKIYRRVNIGSFHKAEGVRADLAHLFRANAVPVGVLDGINRGMSASAVPGDSGQKKKRAASIGHADFEGSARCKTSILVV
jgi:hypothetical protein